MSEQAPRQAQRLALGVEYDGSAYSGWQRQSAAGNQGPNEVATVQKELEAALSAVANHAVTVTCAGRTDAGVHATAQVVNFDCAVDRGEKAWVRGVNSLLPRSVRARWVRPVTEDFSARFSALARRYHYLIYTRAESSAILHGRVSHVPYALDVDAMHHGAQALLGEQDFSSFRAAGCQSATAQRNVQRVSVTRHGDFVLLDIQANAFLQHMVRNIAGSLIEIGRGRAPTEWIGELLHLKDRTAAAMTASPQGLYLAEVIYPAECGLPEGVQPPPFFALSQS